MLMRLLVQVTQQCLEVAFIFVCSFAPLLQVHFLEIVMLATFMPVVRRTKDKETAYLTAGLPRDICCVCTGAPTELPLPFSSVLESIKSFEVRSRTRSPCKKLSTAKLVSFASVLEAKGGKHTPTMAPAFHAYADSAACIDSITPGYCRQQTSC